MAKQLPLDEFDAVNLGTAASEIAVTIEGREVSTALREAFQAFEALLCAELEPVERMPERARKVARGCG